MFSAAGTVRPRMVSGNFLNGLQGLTEWLGYLILQHSPLLHCDGDLQLQGGSEWRAEHGGRDSLPYGPRLRSIGQRLGHERSTIKQPPAQTAMPERL